MLDVAEPITKANQQLLNTIADRVELEKKLSQNLDYMQALALKEVTAELEADNQRRELLLEQLGMRSGHRAPRGGLQ
jgi:hypothetical protein